MFVFGFGCICKFDFINCDVGCMGESDSLVDVYWFCMFMLCNVVLIGFYGYNGVYLMLDVMVCYYMNLEKGCVIW